AGEGSLVEGVLLALPGGGYRACVQRGQAALAVQGTPHQVKCKAGGGLPDSRPWLGQGWGLDFHGFLVGADRVPELAGQGHPVQLGEGGQLGSLGGLLVVRCCHCCPFLVMAVSDEAAEPVRLRHRPACPCWHLAWCWQGWFRWWVSGVWLGETEPLSV